MTTNDIWIVALLFIIGSVFALVLLVEWIDRKKGYEVVFSDEDLQDLKNET